MLGRLSRGVRVANKDREERGQTKENNVSQSQRIAEARKCSGLVNMAHYRHSLGHRAFTFPPHPPLLPISLVPLNGRLVH